MRKTIQWIALVGAIMISGSWGAGAVSGQDERNAEEQIHKMRQQMKELVEAGRNDEANRVEQEIARRQKEAHQRTAKESGDRPDQGEAKRRIAELTHRLADLKEQGKSDEAGRVAQQIEEIRQHLERSAGESGERPKQTSNHDLEERLAGLKRRIAEMKEAGRDDEADRLAQEAREMWSRARGAKHGEASGPSEGHEDRIRHLREAAKHLHAAGLQEVAADVARQADRLAHEVDDARQSHDAQHNESPQLARHIEELGQAVREMRQQMERMQKQLQEMSERIEKR